MATIKITDSLGVELITANPVVNSGLGRYFKGISSQLVAATSFVSELRKPLHLAQPGPGGFQLQGTAPIGLGTSQVELTVAAGAKALLNVHPSGKPLFEQTFAGDPMKVPAGTAYVSMLFEANVGLALSHSAEDLTFGIQAGAGATIRSYQRFDLLGTPPTLAEAAKQVIEHFTIPGDVEDLRNMAEGVVSSVSGHGQFQIGCSVDMLAAINPLASLNTISKLGKLDISAGASISAGVEAQVSGEYEIRVIKTGPDTVRLGYHKASGREIGLQLTAKAGVGATLGGRDLLKTFLTKTSTLSEGDVGVLADSGLSTKQAGQMQAALESGLQRTLNLALTGEFSSLKQDDAAFLYDIDLTSLDSAGEEAVHHALDGDLRTLNQLEPRMPAHGITVLSSRLATLRKKRVQWRINMLGIVNVLSVSELVRKGTIVDDPESGEITILDEVSSQRLGAVRDSKKLRNVLYEGAMLSATYKASRVDVNSELKAGQTFFAAAANADASRMLSLTDGIVGLGLLSDSERRTRLAGITQFGAASVTLQADYDQKACEALFLDSAGRPRETEEYEAIGRQAMLMIVAPGDSDSYRLIPMQNDALWKRMKDTGQPGFRSILPPPITGGSEENVRVAVVTADYTLIVWWAEAMSTAARALSEMRAFLGTADPLTLKDNNTFKERRARLEKEMANVIRKNQSSFGDPWGLLAMFHAAAGAAAASATLSSPRLTLAV